MISPKQRKALNTDFYTALGLMLQGSFSASGKKTRWTNYKTNIKDVFVRMHATNAAAFLTIDLQHRDPSMRQLFWEQFLETKVLMQDAFEDDLQWLETFDMPDGSQISRISVAPVAGNIYQKETWPQMLTHLKKSILAFDAFWSDAFDIFKALEK